MISKRNKGTEINKLLSYPKINASFNMILKNIDVNELNKHDFNKFGETESRLKSQDRYNAKSKIKQRMKNRSVYTNEFTGTLGK